jgi:hypothetical protein
MNALCAPFTDLIPTVETGKQNQAGFFDELHLVGPDALENRIACLSQLGVNLLLQRWIRTIAVLSSPPSP